MRPSRWRCIALILVVPVLVAGAGCSAAAPSSSESPRSAPSPTSTSPATPEGPRVTVSVKPKWRVADTVRHVAKETGVGRARLRSALRRADLPRYAKGRLEGLLAPGTYTFAADAAPREIAEGLLARHREIAAATGLLRRARSVGLAPAEVMTVAAIVEAESSRPKYMPKVAAVVHTRLRKKMKLQMDTTVRYGVGKRGNTATYEDLRSDSPYNTYRRAGLPPGPITSPSRKAIESTLSPAPGDAVFFLVMPDDRMRFTADYGRFRRWARELN